MNNSKKNVKPYPKLNNKYYIKRKLKKIRILDSKKINTFKKYYKEKISLKNKQTKPKKRNKIFIIFYNGISLLLFILSYYFYYLSLEKCLEGEDVCSKKMDWIQLKLTQLIISLIISVLLMALMIYNIISKLHLIHFIATFILFYKYSHSTFFHDHGIFNIIGYFFILSISIIIIFISKLILIIIKVKYKYKLISIIILLLYYNIFVSPINCDDWPKGLNNTYIENDINKYGCQIIFPKKCYYKILSYTQDLSKLYHVSCTNKKKDARNNILKHSRSPYINPNTTKFGFPLTNNEEGRKDGKDDIILKRYTFHNLIDMGKPLPQGLPKPEYIVDFSKDPYGELIIDLNYDDALSQERKQLEKNSNPYSDNIIILYVDSISRATALRNMKKTMNFFEKFMPYKGGYNEKYPNEIFHSFQFLKYHSFSGYTFFNYLKLFYGHQEGDLVRMTRYVKQKGYVTCFAADQCKKDNTRTRHNLAKDELYDHQLVLCDPNVMDVNSIIKRCLYGQLTTYHLYEYGNQFWRKYKNNRKYLTIIINDGHEATLEVIKYTDDVIYNFLNSLYDDNLLKDTSVFLFSDHGNGMPSVYYLHDFFQIEKRLPMLFIIINDRKNVDYNQQYFNIQQNQQTFVTAFDIYNTISNLIYGDSYINIKYKKKHSDTPKSPKGQSLFEKINQKERRPQNYDNMAINVCVS